MELIDLLKVLRRWWWLIVVVVLVAELALWLGMDLTEPMYATRVRLQISTPQREDVAAYDEYRSISLRDEITVARNNFSELLQSDEVLERTISQLGLSRYDTLYTVKVELVRDADFLDLIVRARTPSLAAEIANAHVGTAIAYYGELRAKSTNAEKDLFAEQLQTAEEAFRTAETEFAAFQARHGIALLENELATYRQLLEQLQLERDKRLLATLTTPTDLVNEIDVLISQRQLEIERLLALGPMYNLLETNVGQARDKYQLLFTALTQAASKPAVSAARAKLNAAKTELLAAEQAFSEFRTENDVYSFEGQLTTLQRRLEQLQLQRDQRLLELTTAVADPVSEINKLIAQRQEELDRLTSLAPEYNVLAENVDQARAAYQHLLAKYQEAVLKVTAVQAASFIQIVNPAAPAAPDWEWIKLGVLAGIGGLGVGLVLAFLLDYIWAFRQAAEPAPGQEHPAPLPDRADLEPVPQTLKAEQPGPSASIDADEV